LLKKKKKNKQKNWAMFQLNNKVYRNKQWNAIIVDENTIYKKLVNDPNKQNTTCKNDKMDESKTSRLQIFKTY